MARQARSIPPSQGNEPLVRLTCAQCGLSWNARRRSGPRPRWCSDACKQIAYRTRHPERIAAARRAAYVADRRRAQLAWFHQQYQQISSRNPLDVDTAQDLLWELTGRDTVVWRSSKSAYRVAARRWHPDRVDGDDIAFKLLQEAYRVLSATHPTRR